MCIRDRYDSYKYSLYRIFYASILLQIYTFSLLFVKISFGYISLWPILVGLFLIYCSWKKYNFFQSNQRDEIGLDNFNFEFEFGLVGSSLLLLFILPFELEINSDYVSEMILVLISIHQMILGFKRDQGWRRLFGLIGLPLGLISLGTQFGDLILVLFLFLAALTLIGQAVLYSSKGGLGIGSTIEGAEPILSIIGLPNEIKNNESIETNQPPNNDDLLSDNKTMSIGGICAIDGCKNQHLRASSVCYKHKDMTNSWQDVKIPPGIINNSVFDTKKSTFKIVLEKNLIDNLNKIIMNSDKSYKPTKWIPILRVHPDGRLFLEWEKI